MVEPIEVYPLAEFLCDELQARGWTTSDFAARMDNGREYYRNKVIADLVLAVHKDGLLIDDETFDGMARALDISSEMLRNLDAKWRDWPDRRVSFECPESVFGTDVRLIATQAAEEKPKERADPPQPPPENST